LRTALVTNEYKRKLPALSYICGIKPATGHAGAIFTCCHSAIAVFAERSDVGTNLNTDAFAHTADDANADTRNVFLNSARIQHATAIDYGATVFDARSVSVFPNASYIHEKYSHGIVWVFYSHRMCRHWWPAARFCLLYGAGATHWRYIEHQYDFPNCDTGRSILSHYCSAFSDYHPVSD
jgi:hypothetical protein